MDKHKLASFLEQNRDRPFDWATWNCCQFAAEWVKEATGIDHQSAFPDYSTEAEAREVVTDNGGLIALVTAIMKPIHVSQARQGDLVLCNETHASALGICIGVQSAFVGPNGLIYGPTLEGIAAWRVE